MALVDSDRALGIANEQLAKAAETGRTADFLLARAAVAAARDDNLDTQLGMLARRDPHVQGTIALHERIVHPSNPHREKSVHELTFPQGDDLVAERSTLARLVMSSDDLDQEGVGALMIHTDQAVIPGSIPDTALSGLQGAELTGKKADIVFDHGAARRTSQLLIVDLTAPAVHEGIPLIGRKVDAVRLRALPDDQRGRIGELVGRISAKPASAVPRQMAKPA